MLGEKETEGKLLICFNLNALMLLKIQIQIHNMGGLGCQHIISISHMIMSFVLPLASDNVPNDI